jgi:hypothetical protein
LWNIVSAPKGPEAWIPFATASSIAGLMIWASSLPKRPPSPACGLRPPTQIFGAGDAEPLQGRIGDGDDVTDTLARDQ